MEKKLELKNFFGFSLLASGVGVLFFGLAIVASANAQVGRMGGEPPEEATEVCENSSEGDECSFEFNGRRINSTCKTNPRDESVLVCMPERGAGMGQKKGGDNRGGAGKNPPEEKVSKKVLSGDIELRRMREVKRLSRIVDSVEKIVVFLESKDVDVSGINSNLDVFKEKVEAVLVAYSECSALGDDADKSAVLASRTKVKTLSGEAKEYFTGTVKVSIEVAVSQLN